MALLRGILVLVALVAAAGCGGGAEPEVDAAVSSTVAVTSAAFADGAAVPRRFTCDGDDVSPPLAWSGGPGAAWAIVVDDPDAPGGTFVHWVVLDIPAGTTDVAVDAVPEGSVQVTNSAHHASYTGPCPPKGEHRYRFTVYALDAPTGLTGSTSLADALASISDHATARGTLTATYARP